MNAISQWTPLNSPMRALVLAMLLFSVEAAAVSSARCRAQDASGARVGNLASGNPRIRLRRFHVILLFDTNEERHRNAERSMRLVNEVVDLFGVSLVEEARRKDIFLPSPFDIAASKVELTGDAATAAKLDSVIAQLDPSSPGADRRLRPIDPGDIVFFWAETEGQREKGRDYLELANGDRIDREELKRKLEFRDPEGVRRTTLTVFITDHCRTVTDESDVRDRQPIEPSLETGRPPISGLWRALYFGHIGTIDVSSARPEAAAFSSAGASFFARAFNDSFFEPEYPRGFVEQLLNDRLDREDQGVPGLVEWNAEFLPHLQVHTADVFDKEYKRLRANGGYDDDLKAFETARATDPAGQTPVINNELEFDVQEP